MKEIIAKLNKTYENKVRLGIMSVLNGNQSIDFLELKKVLDVTDGNLSSNISVLEELGYLEVIKGFVGKKSRTILQVTKEGKQSFQDHLAALEELILQNKNK